MPKNVIRRFQQKIEDVVPLQGNNILVFFRDGVIRKCDLRKYIDARPQFSILKNRPDYFTRIQIQPGGYGIQWDENLMISDAELHSMGMLVPTKAEDFRAFASERIINTSEAAEILNCSRQYINELVKASKLQPLKSSEKNTLFLKSEVLKRNWQ